MRIPSASTYQKIAKGLALATTVAVVIIHGIDFLSAKGVIPSSLRAVLQLISTRAISFWAMFFGGVLCACFIPRAIFRPAAMGMSLACFSYALGLLYQIAFAALRPEQLPLLSLFGYCGFFLLLLGVIGLFRKLDAEETRPSKVYALVFFGLALPPLCCYGTWELVLEEMQAFLACLILFYGLTLWRLPHYRSFLKGVFLIATIVLLGIVIQAFWFQKLLPVAIILTLPGFVRNNGDEL